jgi:hypothetical protein
MVEWHGYDNEHFNNSGALKIKTHLPVNKNPWGSVGILASNKLA